jgi:hypothetical protein
VQVDDQCTDSARPRTKRLPRNYTLIYFLASEAAARGQRQQTDDILWQSWTWHLTSIIRMQVLVKMNDHVYRMTLAGHFYLAPLQQVGWHAWRMGKPQVRVSDRKLSLPNRDLIDYNDSDVCLS